MKKIILSNSTFNNSVNASLKSIKPFDFKDVALSSHKLVNSLNPLENIKKNINLLNTNDSFEILKVRLSELSKYKLSQFLNREIQQEILYGGDLVSNKINNEIVSNKFTFNEDKTNNLFLHKHADDFYILIHFKLRKPNKDRKKITDYNNEAIKEQYKNFGNTTGIFHTLTGADYNPDYNIAKQDDFIREGVKEVEEYYPDNNPFYFNINIINKKSETLQYECMSEETKV